MRKLGCAVAWSAILCGATTLHGQTLKLPEAPGRAVTEKICGSCHGAEIVIGRQESRESWAAIVNEMIQRGATGTDEEFFQVVDYLATNLSKTSPVIRINVNKATAADLQKALRISEKQAAAIVQQRSEKGDFKSIDDLKAVPGLDADRIEASRNRLSF